MKTNDMDNIRNIVLVGSSGAGKTTFASTSCSTPKRSAAWPHRNGNTTMDFDADEIEKKMSIALSMGYPRSQEPTHQRYRHTCGYPEFVAEQIARPEAPPRPPWWWLLNAAGSFVIGLEQPWCCWLRATWPRPSVVNRMDKRAMQIFTGMEMIQENSGTSPRRCMYPLVARPPQRHRGPCPRKAVIDDNAHRHPADMADEVEEYRMKLMGGRGERNRRRPHGEIF
jgi:elongation factor G